MPVLVSPHASRALWPMITKGVEGSVTPVTSSPAATTCTSYQIDGISTARWGSLASRGRPVALRVAAATTQLLLPPARAPTSSHPRPGGNGGSSSARGPRAGAPRRDRAPSALGGRPMLMPSRRRPRLRRSSARRPATRPSADSLRRRRLPPVSRPRTSSPHRFSARRHDSRRATVKESTGVHGSGSIPSARNSGGRRQRPIAATAAFTPRQYRLERGAHQRRRGLPFLVGGTAQPQADESLVDAEGGRPEDLGEPSARRASIELHLPEPFAAVQKADGEPGVLDVARVDVRHAVGVEQDLDWRGQAGQAQLPVQAAEPSVAARTSQTRQAQSGQSPSERAVDEPSGGGQDACVSRDSQGRVLNPPDGPNASTTRPEWLQTAPSTTSACRPENRSHRIGCWRGHLTPGSCGVPFAVQGPEVTPAASVCCPLMPVFVIKWSTHCDRG